MEEADRILIDSLISVGLELEDESVTLEQFSPDILINATSLCLEYIFESRNEHQSFPKSCPVNMASRYKVGQALSEAIKSLGYKDALGYQSFLYPNVKDTRNIISFLIENLPKDSGPSVVEGLDQSGRLKSVIKTAFSDNWKSPWLPFYCRDIEPVSKPVNCSYRSALIPFESDRKQLRHLSDWFDSFPSLIEQFPSVDDLLICAGNYERRTRLCENVDQELLFRKIEMLRSKEAQEKSMIQSLSSAPEVRKRTKFQSKAPPAPREKESADLNESAAELAESEFNALRANYEDDLARFEQLTDKYERLSEKLDSIVERERHTDAEIEELRKQLQVHEKAVLVLQHGDSSDDKLRAAIAKRELQLGQLERQWADHKAELTGHIATVRAGRLAGMARTRQLEERLVEVRGQMDECRADYQQKEAEIRVLDDKVKHVLTTSTRPGGGSTAQSRGDFTKRILELTENRKKQAAEVRRILADIFELHRELNSLRGKLERCFADTSRCIGSSAKRDEAARRMHRVLLGIHDNCASLVAVIEEKGRLLREVRELETSIAAEDADAVDKNLARILADHEAATASCAELKRLLKSHKAAATIPPVGIAS